MRKDVYSCKVLGLEAQHGLLANRICAKGSLLKAAVPFDVSGWKAVAQECGVVSGGHTASAQPICTRNHFSE